MKKFILWKLCVIGFGAVLAVRSAVAETSRIMICHDTPESNGPRYYKRSENNFGVPNYYTRLGGEWIPLCTEQYMSVKQKGRLRGDDGFITALEIKATPKPTALVCDVKSLIEYDDFRTIHLYRQWILDFELLQYQVRANQTGQFKYQGEFKEKVFKCELFKAE